MDPTPTTPAGLKPGETTAQFVEFAHSPGFSLVLHHHRQENPVELIAALAAAGFRDQGHRVVPVGAPQPRFLLRDGSGFLGIWRAGEKERFMREAREAMTAFDVTELETVSRERPWAQAVQTPSDK